MSVLSHVYGAWEVRKYAPRMVWSLFSENIDAASKVTWHDYHIF